MRTADIQGSLACRCNAMYMFKYAVKILNSNDLVARLDCIMSAFFMQASEALKN